MRRIVFLLLGALAVCNISAQEEVRLDYRSKDDVFSLSVGGFSIGFGDDTPKRKPWCKNTVDFQLIGPFYHGWSHLVQSEYYGKWAGQGNFLRIDDTFSFGMKFLDLSVALNRSGSLRATFGARWTFTNYYLSNRVWFYEDADGNPIPVPYSGDKSKPVLRSSYLGFPLGLSYNLHGVRIIASVSAEWLTRSYARYKGSNTKYSLPGINDFRSAVELIIGYRGIGAYVAYGLTPMFTKGSGNDAHTLTAGFLFFM